MTFRQAVGDFFAPFFRIRFIDVNELGGGLLYGANGEESLLTESVSASAEFLSSGDLTTFRVGENDQMSQLRSYATSFTVTVEGGSHTTATLHLEPTYLDALDIVDNQVIQRGALMLAEWGYLDARGGLLTENKYSRAGIFQITDPSLTLSESGAQIDIVGVDVFGASLVKRETRRQWDRNGDYSTDLSIIKEIVDRNGMTLDTSQVGIAGGAAIGSVASAAGASAAVHSLEVKHPDETKGEPPILEQNESDWAFFQRLVFTNNCNFYTQGRTVFLVDWNQAKRAQANYRLMMYTQPRTDIDIPMESFQTAALEYLFNPPAAYGVRAVTTDIDFNAVKNAADSTSTSTDVYDPVASTDNQMLGKKQATGRGNEDGRSINVEGGSVKPSPAFEENQAGKGFYIPFGTQNREELAKQPARRGALNYKATATIPGTPNIETMQVVEVVGVGKVMSGFYLVLKATHSLSTGGYSTELELVRDGSSGDTIAGKGTQPAAQADPAPAEGGPLGDSVAALPLEQVPQ